MTYRLNPRLFVENGPTLLAAEAHARSSIDAFRAWSALNPDRRLALVESALRRPANDIDGLPVAL